MNLSTILLIVSTSNLELVIFLLKGQFCLYFLFTKRSVTFWVSIKIVVAFNNLSSSLFLFTRHFSQNSQFGRKFFRFSLDNIVIRFKITLLLWSKSITITYVILDLFASEFFFNIFELFTAASHDLVHNENALKEREYWRLVCFETRNYVFMDPTEHFQVQNYSLINFQVRRIASKIHVGGD